MFIGDAKAQAAPTQKLESLRTALAAVTTPEDLKAWGASFFEEAYAVARLPKFAQLAGRVEVLEAEYHQIADSLPRVSPDPAAGLGWARPAKSAADAAEHPGSFASLFDGTKLRLENVSPGEGSPSLSMSPADPLPPAPNAPPTP